MILISFPFYSEVDENGKTIKILESIPPKSFKVGDQVVVIDNSYNIDFDTNKSDNLIIGHSGCKSKYFNESATVLKNNCKKAITWQGIIRRKQQCDLLIEFQDGKKYYVASNCVCKNN